MGRVFAAKTRLPDAISVPTVPVLERSGAARLMTIRISCRIVGRGWAAVMRVVKPAASPDRSSSAPWMGADVGYVSVASVARRWIRMNARGCGSRRRVANDATRFGQPGRNIRVEPAGTRSIPKDSRIDLNADQTWRKQKQKLDR